MAIHHISAGVLAGATLKLVPVSDSVMDTVMDTLMADMVMGLWLVGTLILSPCLLGYGYGYGYGGYRPYGFYGNNFYVHNNVHVNYSNNVYRNRGGVSTQSYYRTSSTVNRMMDHTRPSIANGGAGGNNYQVRRFRQSDEVIILIIVRL